MTGFLAVDVRGINEAIKGIEVAGRKLRQQDRRANAVVARAFAGWARSDASSGTPQQRHFAGAIRPRATQAVARTAIVATGANAGAQGTFWGSKRYAQFPAWVGNTWQPAVAGQGPYVLNATADHRQRDIADLYAAARVSAFDQAFPDGKPT